MATQSDPDRPPRPERRSFLAMIAALFVPRRVTPPRERAPREPKPIVWIGHC